MCPKHSKSETYQAQIVRVIDGDTYIVDVRLGLGVTKRERLRLCNINCPERNAHIDGKRAAERAAKWWAQQPDRTATITTCGRDGYGRLLATVANTYNPRVTLEQYLLAGGICDPKTQEP